MINQETSYYFYTSPFGAFTLEASSAGLRSLAFGHKHLKGKNSPSAITNEAANQIQEYLQGKRWAFDLPFDLVGTDFQKEVWLETQAVPYGEIWKASDIAANLGCPKAFRSVGAALKLNPLVPILPSHRIEPKPANQQIARIYEGLREVESRFKL